MLISEIKMCDTKEREKYGNIILVSMKSVRSMVLQWKFILFHTPYLMRGPTWIIFGYGVNQLVVDMWLFISLVGLNCIFEPTTFRHVEILRDFILC